jgi:hypothetical protein
MISGDDRGVASARFDGFGRGVLHVFSAGPARPFLDHILDQISFVQPVVVAGVQAGSMEEDLLAIIPSDESEATITNHLLDLAATFGTARHGTRPAPGRRRTPTTSTAASTAGRSKAIGRNEFIAEKIEENGQILEPLLLGGQQNLTIFRFDDAVAEARIFVRHEEARFNFVECQHDSSPNRWRSIQHSTRCRSRGRAEF